MRLYGYIVRAIRKLELAYDIIWKGGEEVLAMLFASRVITGRTKFKEVPTKLQPKVRQILVDEGLEELCEEE